MGILRYLKRLFTTRMFILAIAMILQLVLLVLGTIALYNNTLIKGLSIIFSIVVVAHIVNRPINTSYKLIWSIEVLFFPFTGIIVYYLFAEQKVPKSLKADIIENLKIGYNVLDKNDECHKIKDTSIRNVFEYAKRTSKMLCHQNTKIKYFSEGNAFFNDLFEKIENAKSFIFLEFFIVKDGKLFRRLKDLLEKKVKQGVQVYFMYDDGGVLGCTTLVPFDPKKELESIGVHVTIFSPITIHLSLLSKANNRDHRKICVIDNKYAFTGGYNVADEYPNYIEEFGYWKDTGVLLEGEAVSTYSVMFIQFYNSFSSNKLSYVEHLSRVYKAKSNSFVLGFSDSPADDDEIGKNVHLLLINNAKKYVYIHTPYLIIDYEIISALIRAAKTGVEVIVTVPHIPDKKSVFQVTKANCEKLIKGGVKVFEFTPGFVHSKMFVVDDKVALNGTINMDFRSYYLHYETGLLIANDPEIKKMKKDYLETLGKSIQITENDIREVNYFVRKFRELMGIFSPLL